jgi:hypothetical protein
VSAGLGVGCCEEIVAGIDRRLETNVGLRPISTGKMQAPKVPLNDTVLGRKHRSGIDLQCCLKVSYGSLKVVNSVAGDSISVGETQVVLNFGPRPGQGFASSDSQRLAVVLDSPLEVFPAVPGDAPVEDASQFVLALRPFLGQFLAKCVP